MSIYDRFRVLFDETLSVYDPATAGGSLFIIFALCGVFLLVSKRPQDTRIGKSYVFPSIFLSLLAINPILIHYLLKFTLASANKVLRLSRIYWVFPFVPIIIYCLVEALSSLKGKWKKVFVSCTLLLLLFWGTGGTVLQHYSIAENPYKVPNFTVELSDMILENADNGRPSLVAPSGMLHWFRQYESHIFIPTDRMDTVVSLEPLDRDTLNAEEIAAAYTVSPYANFIVLNGDKPCDGSLEDYGFALVGTVENFELYKRIS